MEEIEESAGAPASIGEAPRPVVHGMRCPVCGGQGEESEGTLHRCATCDVLYRNPRPSQGEITRIRDGRFAGALSRNHTQEIKAEVDAANEAMRGYHRAAAGKDAALNGFGKRVLDIGCGLGFRMRQFDQYGWLSMGLEPTQEAFAYTKAVLLHVMKGDFDTLPKGAFQFVVLEGVLEEVADPAGLVEKVSRILAAGAVVYASVAAPEKEAPLGNGQLYRFGEEGLRKLFMQAGFAEPEVRRDAGKLRMWFKRKGAK